MYYENAFPRNNIKNFPQSQMLFFWLPLHLLMLKWLGTNNHKNETQFKDHDYKSQFTLHTFRQPSSAFLPFSLTSSHLFHRFFKPRMSTSIFTNCLCLVFCSTENIIEDEGTEIREGPLTWRFRYVTKYMVLWYKILLCLKRIV